MYELFCKITVFTNQTAKDPIPGRRWGYEWPSGVGGGTLCLASVGTLRARGVSGLCCSVIIGTMLQVPDIRGFGGHLLCFTVALVQEGPTVCDCSTLSRPCSVGSLLVFFVSLQVGFLPEPLNVSLAPSPSQVSVLSDSCPHHARRSGFGVLCSTASELLVSPPAGGQRCLASFPRQR